MSAPGPRELSFNETDHVEGDDDANTYLDSDKGQLLDLSKPSNVLQDFKSSGAAPNYPASKQHLSPNDVRTYSEDQQRLLNQRF